MTPGWTELLRLALGILCGVSAAACVAQVSRGSVTDDGAARLGAMLDERVSYIRTQGGPHPEPADALRRTALMFDMMDNVPCPDCPIRKPLTAEEQAAYAATTRLDAEAGKPAAELRLGALYLQGKGVERDVPQGLKWLKSAAGDGDDEAAFALAQMYDQGINFSVDQSEAARFYEMAATKPPFAVLARRRLAEMNEFGLGVPQNYARAMALYESEIAPPTAAPPPARWSQWSEFSVGRMYAQGKGVPQDYAKAAEWFLVATDQGTGYGGMVADAECALAIMYSTGLGVTRDPQRAEFFLRRPNALTMKACQGLRAELARR